VAKKKKRKHAEEFAAAPLATPAAAASPFPNEVLFRYIKSSFYRVISADGVYGGGTTSGMVHVAIFSEKSPVPSEQRFKIDPKGTLVEPPLSQMGTDFIEREVEASLIISPAMARRLSAWLVNAATNAEASIAVVQQAVAAATEAEKK
jgi:hypothetical protein